MAYVLKKGYIFFSVHLLCILRGFFKFKLSPKLPELWSVQLLTHWPITNSKVSGIYLYMCVLLSRNILSPMLLYHFTMTHIERKYVYISGNAAADGGSCVVQGAE